MALDTDEDLLLFFEDDGIDVSFDAGVTFKRALKEEFDEKVNEGSMHNSSIGRIKAITLRTVDVASLQMNALVHIGSSVYRVRDKMQIQDGKFTHLLLKDQVQV